MEASENRFDLGDFLRIPFRERCQRKCCNTVLWTHCPNQNANAPIKQLLVPLTDVHIQGILEAGHATIDVQLTYKNMGEEDPIECTFEFPVDEKTLVSKIIAQIDDRVIETVIQKKDSAK